MFNLKTLVKTAAITAVSLALAPAAFAGGHGKHCGYSPYLVIMPMKYIC